jgi:hypothetical protein
MRSIIGGSTAEQDRGADLMIDFILAITAFLVGVLLATLFRLLFEVRYNQLQRILKEWINGDHP